MGSLPGDMVLMLAGIVAMAVLAFLYQLAVSVRNEVYLHDLKVRVAELQAEQCRRLKQIAEATGGLAKVKPETRRAA